MKASTTQIAKKVAEKNDISNLNAHKLVISVMESIQELISEGYETIDLYGVATLNFRVQTPKQFYNVVTGKVEKGKPRIKTTVRVKDKLKEKLRRKRNVSPSIF